MFSFISGKIVHRKVEKALRDRKMRTGVFSFMYMSVYELERDYTFDFKKSKQVKRWTRNAGADFAPIVVEALSEGSPKLYEKLANLYPYIIHSFLNILDTAEMKSAMYINTQEIDRTKPRLTVNEVVELLSDEINQCEILFESYPVEMGNIVTNIKGFNDDAIIRDDIINGNFRSLFEEIARRPGVQDPMRENANYYCNFAKMLNA